MRGRLVLTMSANTENVIADYEAVRDRAVASLGRAEACLAGLPPADTNQRDNAAVQQKCAALLKENAQLRAELEWAKALLSMYEMARAR